jgi:hypothetical protein
VGFAVGKVALGQVSVPVLWFSLVSIIPPMLILNFIVILLLSEGQAGEDWERSNKTLLSWIWGSIGYKKNTLT